MYDVQNREEELVRLRKERDKLLTQVSKLSKLREKNAELQRELGEAIEDLKVLCVAIALLKG